MANVGLFYGTDTGNTEIIARMIQQEFGLDVLQLHDIARSTQEQIEAFDLLIFGIPTWYYGEPQCDWDDFFPTLEKIDFKHKTIAIFGCGDQEDYGEYFCSAMGTIADIVTKNNGHIVGHWPSASYRFIESDASIDKDTLVGLCIDEDRQPELTRERVTTWVKQLRTEMQI